MMHPSTTFLISWICLPSSLCQRPICQSNALASVVSQGLGVWAKTDTAKTKIIKIPNFDIFLLSRFIKFPNRFLTIFDPVFHAYLFTLQMKFEKNKGVH